MTPKLDIWPNLDKGGLIILTNFALVAILEAIKMFLAYEINKNFKVYQMDVKSDFFYGDIEE